MAEQKETASPETKPEPWVGRLLREGELEDDSDRDVTSSDGSVLEEDAPEGKSGISLAVAAKQPSPKLYMHSSRIDVEAAEDEVARANRVKYAFTCPFTWPRILTEGAGLCLVGLRPS